MASQPDAIRDLLIETDKGLYCPAGDFHIDPWLPVDRAVITHAHSDHARPGHRAYLAAAPGIEVLRLRVGTDAAIQSIQYGERISLNGVTVSLHPAGHLLGSAQVRVEYDGHVWVISGDFKTHADSTCAPFEQLTCDTFITESTFGLPVYRWDDPHTVFDGINQWWRSNQEAQRCSVIFGYALGKAQRVLAGIDASIGPILAHGAVTRFLPAYQAAGIKLPEVLSADADTARKLRSRALVIAPPSAANSPWMRKFGPVSTATASGRMRIRGNRRRGNVDRGFVLSDHADWDGLLTTIRASGASRVGVTHGYTEALARYLNETGIKARTYATRFSSRGEEEIPEPEPYAE